MAFQRARSREQIEERRNTIIEAAAAILAEHGIEHVTISSVSNEAGLTRPTIYNYFKTTEEILVQLIIRDYGAWIDELSGSFKLNRIYEIEDLARIWSETMSHYPRFMKLYSMLFTVLETNCSLETLARFKREFLELGMPLREILGQLFPEANEQAIYEFMIFQVTSCVGIFAMSNMSEAQMKAIEMSETGYVPPEFTPMYRQAVYQQLYCLKKGIRLPTIATAVAAADAP